MAEPGEDQDDEALLSDDGFLYARCAVIAAGRRRYEQVLADPTSFGGTWDTGGEALLEVAERVWEKLTGTDWEHEDPVPVWTGSNSDGGWPQDRQVRDFDPVLLDLAGSAARWPDGRVHYNTAHQDCLMVTGPQVETETVALLRAHGGWPPPIAYLIVILRPANYWNFEVHRASGYLDEQGYGRPGADGEHGQKYLRATVMVSKDQQRTWDVNEQLRALRAVVAHVLIDELSRVAPHHGALPTLRQHLDAARQLLPSLPRYA